MVVAVAAPAGPAPLAAPALIADRTRAVFVIAQKFDFPDLVRLTKASTGTSAPFAAPAPLACGGTVVVSDLFISSFS